MKNFSIYILLVVFLVSCTSAKKASEVSAVYIPAETYSGLDCEGLATAAEKVRQTIPNLENAVNSSQRTDKNKEIAAWVVFWPAAMMMDGNAEEQAQLANAKGQIDAIKNAALAKGCGGG